MSSASSATRELLAAYVAGRITAARIVPAIAAEYYRSPDAKRRAALRPVMEVIERAAPGVARLARTESGAGFDIQQAERPFPEQQPVLWQWVEDKFQPLGRRGDFGLFVRRRSVENAVDRDAVRR